MEIKQFNLSKQNVSHFIAKLENLDFSLGYVADVTLKKTTRSIEANRRLWAIYNQIGAYIGESPDKIHELMKWKFLRYQDVVNGETIETVKSTTKLNTTEMADYQRNIEVWASDMGCFIDE